MPCLKGKEGEGKGRRKWHGNNRKEKKGRERREGRELEGTGRVEDLWPS